MRTLCPNFDRADALETVLEVPIPEEMFASNKHKLWQSMKSWITKPNVETFVGGHGGIETQFLLGVIGAPLVPLPIHNSPPKVNHHNIKGQPTEKSMAKYIVQQYIAASGGEHALNSIESMLAVGKVKMSASEIVAGEDELINTKNDTKVKNMMRHGAGEVGGFVMWRKRPGLWSFELMLSGFKISAGTDGKVAWRQTPWQHSHAPRGPPRPLRRSLQGLDPTSTANLFSESICTGEKSINNEDCFVLKLEVEPSALTARSSTNVVIIRHTIWGCFSQRTGLLVQLEDSHLLRIRSPENDVFWETNMESLIQDYRTIDGVNIAHAGRTSVSLLRFEEDSKKNRTRTKMEEIWSVEEVDFNIKELSTDCFLPPADLKYEDDEHNVASDGEITKKQGLQCKIVANSSRTGGAKVGTKVVAIDERNGMCIY